MKMRGQSKWRNHFCGGQSEVLLEKMRNEGWGRGGGQEKLMMLYNLLQMIQDELAEKDVERPVNLRNVERSLLKRVVDDVHEVIGIFDTQNISETRSI